MLQTHVISAEEKVFYDTVPSTDLKSATVFSNEARYLNYTYRATEKCCIPISVSVYCDAVPVSVYRIDFVNLSHTDSGFDEVATEGRAPGAFPDILLPRFCRENVIETNNAKLPFYEANEKNTLNATNDATKALLIGINEDEADIPVGTHEIKIVARSLESGDVLSENSVTLTVLEEKLPEVDFYYTNWVHYDSIADIHGVPVWSDKYFEILASYLKCAVKYGMTLLLTPLFTPPLDTAVGGERMKTQLVKIEKRGDKYLFDFSLFERFVSVAKAAGFKNFEHSHLFTQWGAEHAPNIYISENGEEKLFFGWNTDIIADGYSEFLNQYIPALKAKAKELDIKLFWHISDEPTPDIEKTYKLAAATVEKLLEGERSGDALSDLRFYSEGLVKTPIVSIDCVHKFFGRCENLWGYYTGGYYANHTNEKCTNRLITDKPYRTRIGALHFFKYRLEGFLHWGYNFYYDKMTTGLFDPKVTPSGYKNLPGASYIVYPYFDQCLPSLRAVYMKNSITDLRALKLLESKIGYDGVISLAEDFFGGQITAETMPKSAEEMLSFRELITEQVSKH